jgi:hypothetical protein
VKTNLAKWVHCGLLLMLAPTVQSQQDAQAKPLGDVAREQKQVRKQQNSNGKVYGAVGTPSEKSDPQSNSLASKSQPTETVKLARRSVFDQAKSKTPDFIIVPAGTEIRVDIVDGKVIVPVRVGFSTPIPALSVASVKVHRLSYTPVLYSVAPGSLDNASLTYAETADLTAVTVDGATYPVEARTVALNGGATVGSAMSMSSSRDAAFVLTAPLAIKR